jgi:hypothetical protein
MQSSTQRLLFADSKNRDVQLYPSGSSYVLHLTTPIKDIERVDLVSARVTMMEPRSRARESSTDSVKTVKKRSWHLIENEHVDTGSAAVSSVRSFSAIVTGP